MYPKLYNIVLRTIKDISVSFREKSLTRKTKPSAISPLLTAIGKTDKPVFLKRGISATLNEFLMSAEYILSGGNEQVILCERGIKSFDPSTRNLFDVAAVAVVKGLSHLPIIVDPSHATGKRMLVPVMTKAALVAGAHGVMMEVHPNPAKALCDGAQSLSGEHFAELMQEINRLLEFLGYQE